MHMVFSVIWLPACSSEVALDLILGFPDVLGRDFKVVDTAILLLGIYVAGQIMATPAKAILEDGKVIRPVCGHAVLWARDNPVCSLRIWHSILARPKVGTLEPVRRENCDVPFGQGTVKLF
jgi:hypothetical protein